MEYSIIERKPGVWFVDLKVGGEREYTGAYIVASGKEVAFVEVGPSSTADNMLHALYEIGYRPENVKYLLPTHVHLDHAGAAGALVKHLPNAYVISHKKGVPHMMDPESTLWSAANKVLGFVAEMYGKPEPIPPEKIIPVEEETGIDVGKLHLKIISTPGHASHHLSVFHLQDSVVFTGDAAGIYVPSLDVVLPATPPPFRLAQALKSIEAMISLGPKLVAYTHFDLSADGERNLNKHYYQLIHWYETTKKAVANRMNDPDDLFDLIAERDDDLKKFLLNSHNLVGLRRGVETSLRGFIQIVEDEGNGGSNP
jgi:glyoxylase-like metal-dependent hydrolase (beta-lactamase superfamily II)